MRLSDLEFIRSTDFTEINVSKGGTVESILVNGWTDSHDVFERFEFADGSAIEGVSFHSAGRIGLQGSDGDDLIVGTSASSIIDAGLGDDTLDAGGYAGSLLHLRG